MHASFIHSPIAGFSTIEVTHNKETLIFNAAVYQPSFKKGNYEPFQQINNYWPRLHPSTQDRIFELFIEARELLNVNDIKLNPLILALRPIVAELLAIHDNEEFERWIQHHGRIWTPEDLDTEYDTTIVRPGSREQTYLVSDYRELVNLIMKLRVIAPIWGEFIEKTKKESGQTFKDLNTYFLISKTRIEDSPAMKRLNDYVAKNIKQDDIDIRSSINGIGSDTFQLNLVANILVRFLVIASLTREPSDTHLVQIIHKTLRNRLSQNESHQNAILEKLNPGEDQNSEDSSSRAEKYKNKPLVAPGDFTAIEKYTEYYEEISARLLLKNELSPAEKAELAKVLKSADAMTNQTFEECQIRLIQWTCSPIITARALWDINKSSNVRLAGIAQFVLWNSGFKDLAFLTTANSLDGVGTYSPESRAHIPKDIIDKLNDYYPFYRRHPTKKANKQDNDAIREIMDLSQMLAEHVWYLNMADEHIAAQRGSASNKTYRVGYDIRIRLAELAIYTQERNKEFLSLYDFQNDLKG